MPSILKRTSLRDATRRAQGVIRNATLIDAGDLTITVFEQATRRMAEAVIDAPDSGGDGETL